MFFLVLLAALLLILNFSTQLTLVNLSTQFIVKKAKEGKLGTNQMTDTKILAFILILILFAHLFQIALWAISFMWIGEFDAFRDAFYHSAVNFASLGYGDIVMSEEWRLLGALEAAAGVMMFGVSAALLFAIISKVIKLQMEQHDSQKGSDSSK